MPSPPGARVILNNFTVWAKWQIVIRQLTARVLCPYLVVGNGCPAASHPSTSAPQWCFCTGAARGYWRSSLLTLLGRDRWSCVESGCLSARGGRGVNRVPVFRTAPGVNPGTITARTGPRGEIVFTEALAMMFQRHLVVLRDKFPTNFQRLRLQPKQPTLTDSGNDSDSTALGCQVYTFPGLRLRFLGPTPTPTLKIVFDSG